MKILLPGETKSQHGEIAKLQYAIKYGTDTTMDLSVNATTWKESFHSATNLGNTLLSPECHAIPTVIRKRKYCS